MEVDEILRKRIEVHEFDLTVFLGIRAANTAGGRLTTNDAPRADLRHGNQGEAVIRDRLANLIRIQMGLSGRGSLTEARDILKPKLLNWWNVHQSRKVREEMKTWSPKAWLKSRIAMARETISNLEVVTVERKKLSNQVIHATEGDIEVGYEWLKRRWVR